MRILGIDVGFSGGLAVITDDGVLINYRVMPVIVTTSGGKKKKTISHLDIPALIEWIERQEVDIAVIEKVAAMPKQGIVSMFRFGEQFGAIQGVLCGLRISHSFVRPAEWKKKVLAGYDKADKASSLLYVSRRWPVAKIKGTKQQRQGLADAICIALSNGGER